MSFISDQIKDSGMYDHLVEQVIDELEALEKQNGDLEDRIKELEQELAEAKAALAAQAQQCSSLCHKDEPCSITADGKCDAAAQAQQSHIADTSKLAQAVNVIASQTGESAESIIEWLTNQGGLTQLMLSHFGGIAAQAQQESQEIGEMRENGVNWYGKNPHAFALGTKFFALPPAPEGGE